MKFRLSGAFNELSPVREGVHNGIDLAVPEGEALRSIASGTVEAVRDYGAQNIGKGVIIKASDGNFHIYGHMQNINVEPGQTIEFGEVLGQSGATGHAHGAHLHFGIQTPDGNFIDPSDYAELLSAVTGDINPAELTAAIEATEKGSGFLDGIRQFWENGQIDQYQEGPDLFWQWIGGEFKDVLIWLWDWFVINLPDIMGYITILTAIVFILSAMFSGRGMIKVISIYAGLLILSLLILGG